MDVLQKWAQWAFRVISWFSVIFFFSLICTKLFSNNLPFWESTVLIVRRHVLGQVTSLNNVNQFIFSFYSRWGRIIFFNRATWTQTSIYLFILLPFIFLMSLILTFLNYKILKIILLVAVFLFLVPVPFLVKSGVDGLVISTHFDLLTPFSPKYVWIGSQGSDLKAPYTLFTYSWNQKSPTKNAQIKLSCLGHYQLLINGEDVYHGPEFGVSPIVYYDNIDIHDNVAVGHNSLAVICNFINRSVHEYDNYPSPALLVGGYVSDGLISRNLADARLWNSAALLNFQNGQQISADTGYAEKFDLSSFSTNLKPSLSIDEKFTVLPRPLPLLTVQSPNLLSGQTTMDLESFSTGYLTFVSNFASACDVKANWVKKEADGQVSPDFNQTDVLRFPAGNYTYHQFSRRSGRYLQIDLSACQGDLKVYFSKVGMAFSEVKPPNFSSAFDSSIYQLALNTLSNNIQDHFEDSVERERAQYLGDSLAVGKCLLVSDSNLPLIKQAILQFAQSQNKDGSMASLAPSGLKQMIPAYSLQWIALLDLYLSRSHDNQFAAEMYPHLQAVLAWARRNGSAEGFLYNKYNDQDWWSFIDWTPFDDSYQYSTPLQLWYYRSLLSASEIARFLNKPDSFRLQSQELGENLRRYAYSEDGLFADSFGLNGKSKPSLITNALAGKFGVFPDDAASTLALNQFDNMLTMSPYSETWVVDWLLKLNKRDQALEVIRNYWGGMVKEGETTIPEVLPTAGIVNSPSNSHAWGCSPVYSLNLNSADSVILNY